MRTYSIDITPDSHVIQSMINSRLSSPEAISELVDNSFDAAADNVDVDFDSTSLKVTDDGKGCSDTGAMLALGNHKPTSDTKLGRYGVGLPTASCNMGEFISITTVHDKIKRTAAVTWSDIEERGWKSVVGTESDAEDQRGGTVIEINRLRRMIYQKPLVEALAFTFAPALWAGRTISVNNEPVSAWLPPITTGEITYEEEHPALPISYKLRAGLTDLNEHDPFILAYEHRIICGTTEPCGRFNTSSRFVALVTLVGNWPLLQHKDGLRYSKEATWLYESLQAACLPLLSQVHQMGENVELDMISADLEDAVFQTVGKAKRPNRNGKQHQRPAANTNRKVVVAEKVAGNGDVEERITAKHRRGFAIVYCKLTDGLLGKVDVNGLRICVQLNEDHSFIAAARDRKNLDCLKACAAFLLCNQQATNTDSAQMLMSFEAKTESDKFVEMASRVFESLAKSRGIERLAA